MTITTVDAAAEKDAQVVAAMAAKTLSEEGFEGEDLADFFALVPKVQDQVAKGRLDLHWAEILLGQREANAEELAILANIAGLAGQYFRGSALHCYLDWGYVPGYALADIDAIAKTDLPPAEY